MNYLLSIINFQKKESVKMEAKIHSSTIIFHTQLSEILIKFFKNISCNNKNKFQILKLCLDNLESSKDKSRKLLKFKLAMIDEIKFLLLCMIEKSTKQNKKILSENHSVLHLLSLYLKNEEKEYSQIKNWLNINWALENNNDELHAIRGNIEILIDKYPGIKKPLEKIIEIEQFYESRKLSKKEYNQSKKDWVLKNKSEIPKKCYKILYCKRISSKVHWTEAYCFELSLSKKTEDILEKCKPYNFEKDKFYCILIGNIQNLLKELDCSWMKLVVSLVCGVESRAQIYSLIQNIGLQLFDFDWNTSMEYFLYTVYSNYYFEKVCAKLEMNPAIYDYLLRYAKRNKLIPEPVISAYCQYLQEKEDLVNLSKLIYLHPSIKLEYTKNLLKELVLNYKENSVCTDNFLNTEIGLFVKSYNSLMTSQTYDEYLIKYIFSSKYIFSVWEIVLSMILEKENCTERLLLSSINFLIRNVNTLNSTSSRIKNYKQCLLDKLSNLNES